MSKSNHVPKGLDAAAIVEAVEEASRENVPVPNVVLTVVKPEPEAVAAPEAPAPKLSLEEKIQKVEDLTLLIERFRALTESKRKLTVFQLGADGMSSSIALKDAAGNEFKTSNSAVISAVIDEMKRILDQKVRDIEEQINF